MINVCWKTTLFCVARSFSTFLTSDLFTVLHQKLKIKNTKMAAGDRRWQLPGKLMTSVSVSTQDGCQFLNCLRCITEETFMISQYHKHSRCAAGWFIWLLSHSPLCGLYLSVLLGGLDHVHVHIIHQVGHFRHVLHNLVRLSRSISLKGRNKRSLISAQDAIREEL